MYASDQLERVNQELQKLLATSRPADVTPVHTADELMVWFLLGGKDVGKSTFLNALLGETVSEPRAESAEGTNHFVAYVHERSREYLAARLAALDIEVEYHTHTSAAHERLCLIDSPDFDSRYDRHVHQVRQVLQVGVADGAVLLASHAKYKDRDYWDAFSRLFGVLTPSHILFVITKADEVADYEAKIRADFTATITRRVASSPGENGDPFSASDARVFLIDSLRRKLDFGKLEGQLLRKMSARAVRNAQADNVRHAMLRAATEMRRHYHLDELTENLAAATAPERLDEIFGEHFANLYFETVGERLRTLPQLNDAVRERINQNPGPTLAGLPALQSLGRLLTSWLPLQKAAGDESALAAAPRLDLRTELRWGREPLVERLQRAQREALSRLRLEEKEAGERHLEDERDFDDELTQLLADQITRPPAPLFPAPLRLLLNLPVYMYLIFFVTVLFYPALLLLEAWGVFSAPRLDEVLTLDNVKVSVIGFVGYYIMALLFTLRRQRDRVRRATFAIVDDFLMALQTMVRAEIGRPLARFRDEFEKLARDLNTDDFTR